MDPTAIIRAEAQRFADVLAATAPDARCPTCPEWSASDLLWHLIVVHQFWAGVLARGVTTDPNVAAIERVAAAAPAHSDGAAPARPDNTADLLALREQATTALLEQLDRLDDAEPRWSWW